LAVSWLFMDLRSLRYFVAVADARHVGRAAAGLHMTQPPLSRAIRQLEAELGVTLLHRTRAGVTLTDAGSVLYDEARAVLERTAQLRARVTAAAGPALFTIGVLADSAEQAGTRLAAAFRERHPDVDVRVREADLADPSTGLRAGLVDVALTRAPFDDRGIRTLVLRSDPVGVVLRADDPLAGRDAVTMADLAGRRWFRFPDGTDPAWQAYWARGRAGSAGDEPVVRTVQECLQAVLWSNSIGLTPLGPALDSHTLPGGVTIVPLLDMPPSELVVAWNRAAAGPLVRSFARIAAVAYLG
jgi:DNA-binding transcriptional LysR family regulator